MQENKRTVLYDKHVLLGAQMVPFGGWEMPVRYTSDKEEHLAVRTKAGMFDVSHMGEITLIGAKACELADTLLTNNISALANGQAAYACMLNERGTIIDDVVAYKFSDSHVLVCVNASNIEGDFAWMQEIAALRFSDSDVNVTNDSKNWAQIAVQGPLAPKIVEAVADKSLAAIKRYHFEQDTITLEGQTVNVIFARTGYTGEDGFEIFVPPQHAGNLWDALQEKGHDDGLIPCGLASRDTLRLEAGMCLYGNDIDDTKTPLEAGLSWVVKWDKPISFVGKEALLEQKDHITRKLCGIVVTGKGIARHGYTIVASDGTLVGQVTSGTLAPFLNQAIAMGYVQKPHDKIDTPIGIDIRGRIVEAKIVKLPFYKAKM